MPAGGPPGAAEPLMVGPAHPRWKGDNSEARALATEYKYNPRHMSAEELAEHDGTVHGRPLLLAFRSSEGDAPIIVDVSDGADYYAPSGPYHCFAGRDCSRALSLTSLRPEHLHGNMEAATASEWAVLDEWATKLTAKYPVVGSLVVIATPAEVQLDAPESKRVETRLPEVPQEVSEETTRPSGAPGGGLGASAYAKRCACDDATAVDEESCEWRIIDDG